MKRDQDEDFKAYAERRKRLALEEKRSRAGKMLWQSTTGFVNVAGKPVPTGGGKGTYIKAQHGELC